MDEPKLWYCAEAGYRHVTLDVLETILDREGIRQARPHDIVRDKIPRLLQNKLDEKRKANDDDGLVA